jgi:hypothetical protein
MKDELVMKSELNNVKHLRSQPQCPLVDLRDFLEAENNRLRQTVIELSLETLALRDALNGNGCPRNAA